MGGDLPALSAVAENLALGVGKGHDHGGQLGIGLGLPLHGKALLIGFNRR